MKKKFSSALLIPAVLTCIFVSCDKDTIDTGRVKDIEGNSYKTIRIGKQVWMSENLRTTRYNDGSVIPVISDSVAWRNLDSPGLCWYKNDSSAYHKEYGALYNGYAISGEVCPEGWHIPSVEEFKQLIEFSGDTAVSGGRLKQSGTLHWMFPNTGADNKSGFNAPGAGIRYYEGSYRSLLYFTCFWCSTEEDSADKRGYVSLYYNDAHAKTGHIKKNYGFSIRCIKDN